MGVTTPRSGAAGQAEDSPVLGAQPARPAVARAGRQRPRPGEEGEHLEHKAT